MSLWLLLLVAAAAASIGCSLMVAAAAPKVETTSATDPGDAPVLSPAQQYAFDFNTRMNATRRKCDEKLQLCNERVTRVFDLSNCTTTSLTFSYQVELKSDKTLTHGLETRPGDMMLFDVPPQFWNTSTIDRVWLVHRKNYNSDVLNDTVKLVTRNGLKYTWDVEAAYHSVGCWNAAERRWRQWHGPRYSTQWQEPRRYDDPVFDNRRYAPPREAKNPLYDHLDNWSKYMDDGPVPCRIIGVRNVSPAGYGSAHGFVHSIRVEYRPHNAVDRKLQTIRVFTPSTLFRDDFTPVPHFGGGREITPTVYRHQKYIYPEAITVSSTMKGVVRYEPWLVTIDNGLVIRLRSNQSLAQCEVALGNTKEPTVATANTVDRDGWVGAPGLSYVFASVRELRNTSYAQVLFHHWPLEGSDNGALILRIAPQQLGYTTPVGEDNRTAEFGTAVVRLESQGDPLHVMGVRCQYYATPSPLVLLGKQIVSTAVTNSVVPPSIESLQLVPPPTNGTAATITNATTSTSSSIINANQTSASLVVSVERSLRHAFGAILGDLRSHRSAVTTASITTAAAAADDDTRHRRETEAQEEHNSASLPPPLI